MGDRGLGFDSGEVGVVFLLAFALSEADVCLGFGAATVADLVATGDRPGFSLEDSLDGSLKELLDDTGCLGDRVGCFGE